jgi:hypothetical protein
MIQRGLGRRLGANERNKEKVNDQPPGEVTYQHER